MSFPSLDNPLILTVILYFNSHFHILSNLAHHSSFDQEKDTSFNVRTDLLSHTICEGISVMPYCSRGVASGALTFETFAWDGKLSFKSSTGLFSFQGQCWSVLLLVYLPETDPSVGLCPARGRRAHLALESIMTPAVFQTTIWLLLSPNDHCPLVCSVATSA